MRKRLPVCVLQTEGTNCDRETAHAFERAQAKPETVHVNELKRREKDLRNYKILVLPGGFANGDYGGGAGRILGLELINYLSDQMLEFKEKGGLILGVCNGFQVLVRTGLLPFGNLGETRATLDQNDSGHFECRWANLKIEEKNACVFLDGEKGVVSYQVAHGEGKFYTDPQTLQAIENQNLVVFRYCDVLGNPTQEYPQNPNGALNAIAGICDPSGRILGLMPHPERFVVKTHHPNWRRMPDLKAHGLPLFQRLVSYASQM